MAQIETPTMGEILREEFMEPMGISAYRLAIGTDYDICVKQEPPRQPTGRFLFKQTAFYRNERFLTGSAPASSIPGCTGR